MSEWRKIWANGFPNEDRSPKSGHRMAAEGMPFPWRWNGGTISTDLDVIWGMSIRESSTAWPVSCSLGNQSAGVCSATTDAAAM